MIRRAFVGLLVLISGLGLANAFGQRPSTSNASTGAADVEVYAPARVRAGLYHGALHDRRAPSSGARPSCSTQAGRKASPSTRWSTSPIGEASEDGKLVFELGHVPAGEKYVLFIHSQVNPTNVGRRSQDVELRDGDTTLAHIDRTITIFP